MDRAAQGLRWRPTTQGGATTARRGSASPRGQPFVVLFPASSGAGTARVGMQPACLGAAFSSGPPRPLWIPVDLRSDRLCECAGIGSRLCELPARLECARRLRSAARAACADSSRIAEAIGEGPPSDEVLRVVLEHAFDAIDDREAGLGMRLFEATRIGPIAGDQQPIHKLSATSAMSRRIRRVELAGQPWRWNGHIVVLLTPAEQPQCCNRSTTPKGTSTLSRRGGKYVGLLLGLWER